MEPIHSVVYLLVGLVVGAILFLKPQALKELPATAYAYLCFGLLLFGASWILSWIGFACVIVSYLFYQGTKGAFSESLTSLVTFQWWPKRRRKETTQPTGNDAESRQSTGRPESDATEESRADES